MIILLSIASDDVLGGSHMDYMEEFVFRHVCGRNKRAPDSSAHLNRGFVNRGNPFLYIGFEW